MIEWEGIIYWRGLPMRRTAGPSVLIAFTLLFAACTGSANAPQPTPTPTPPPPTATAAPAADAGQPTVAFSTPPRPLQLPQDDAAHRDALEWWYYTGHLEADGGRRYGFEFVIFQQVNPQSKDSGGYVGHFAVTDLVRNKFVYTEKLNLAPLPPAGAKGFDLKLDSWSMAGSDGQARIAADLDGYRLELALKATKPPAIHGNTGYIVVSEKENSYYYSRTNMEASGTLTVDGAPVAVKGTAWFDHQWGQMTLSGGGGWDWFALMLDDKSEVMLSIIRRQDGKRVAAYGTYVDPQGKTQYLPAEEITVRNNGLWISPKNNGRYPMGWSINLPKLGLDLTVSPELMDQELDTSASTGVAYWEGASKIQGFKQGAAIGGKAYVELTGYAKPAGSAR